MLEEGPLNVWNPHVPQITPAHQTVRVCEIGMKEYRRRKKKKALPSLEVEPACLCGCRPTNQTIVGLVWPDGPHTDMEVHRELHVLIVGAKARQFLPPPTSMIIQSSPGLESGEVAMKLV